MAGATMALVITTSAVEAAVTKQIISTRVGRIACWVGDAAANTIVDSDNTNCAQGRSGNDTMQGAAGPDRIDGDYADSGTTGRDTIYGGAGADTFYVGPSLAFPTQRGYVDRIMDFEAGETICTRTPFTPGTVRRTVEGTTGEHRYLLAKTFGGEVVIAWVANLGNKAVRVLPACFLQ